LVIIDKLRLLFYNDYSQIVNWEELV